MTEETLQKQQEPTTPVDFIIQDAIAQVNSIIGTEGWQDKVSAITKNVLSIARDSGDVRIFITNALAYDSEQVYDYVLNYKDLNDVIYSAMCLREVNVTQLLIDYLELNSGVPEEQLYQLVSYYVHLVVNVDIHELVDYLYTEEIPYIAYCLLKTFPFYQVNAGELIDQCLHLVMRNPQWGPLAAVFVTVPGIINSSKYAEEINAFIKSAGEEQREEIEKTVMAIYTANPSDTAFHLRVMNLLQNNIVTECFQTIAESAFNSMVSSFESTRAENGEDAHVHGAHCNHGEELGQAETDNEEVSDEIFFSHQEAEPLDKSFMNDRNPGYTEDPEADILAADGDAVIH